MEHDRTVEQWGYTSNTYHATNSLRALFSERAELFLAVQWPSDVPKTSDMQWISDMQRRMCSACQMHSGHRLCSDYRT